jgi:DNA (cytosine-5)-methyltransferase 1
VDGVSAGRAEAVYDASWLRLASPPNYGDGRREVGVVDLFSGCGGMTLGIAEAARALNMRLKPLLAVDLDETALSVYAANFPGVRTLSKPAEKLFGLEPGSAIGDDLDEAVGELGTVDILVGGPPCQGHSNLNNHSRHDDRRNELFMVMARAAELLHPRHVIIENVRDIVHDRGNVFERAVDVLENELGYHVDFGVLRAETLGVPQRRHRTFVVASKSREPDLARLRRDFRTAERSFDWACGDLRGGLGASGFDTATPPRGRTLERINWLHDGTERWELKNELRPPCQRDQEHSYNSVYGRMHPDEPAPTITTGFTCMGQGRFVHPRQRRTITPHEAARLQFFPDFFRFGELNRESYKRLIGNAVPPKLAYSVALDLLR